MWELFKWQVWVAMYWNSWPKQIFKLFVYTFEEKKKSLIWRKIKWILNPRLSLPAVRMCFDRSQHSITFYLQFCSGFVVCHFVGFLKDSTHGAIMHVGVAVFQMMFHICNVEVFGHCGHLVTEQSLVETVKLFHRADVFTVVLPLQLRFASFWVKMFGLAFVCKFRKCQFWHKNFGD